MYILASGVVELRKNTDRGETLLKVVDTKNDFFGEMSLIDDLPRSASAVATQPTQLFVINEKNFEHLIQTNGAFAFKVIQILSERIRSANRKIRELSETDQRERCLLAMVDFAQRFGEKIYNGDLKVCLKDMQEWINTQVGISIKDIEGQVARLIKLGVTPLAATSAKTHESILLSPEFVRQNDRRRQDRTTPLGQQEELT
jgi:CRP-like cAMP-binding protein